MIFAKLFESKKLGQILVTLSESQEKMPAISVVISQDKLLLDAVYVFQTEQQQQEHFNAMDLASAEAIATKLLPEKKVIVDKPKGLLN